MDLVLTSQLFSKICLLYSLFHSELVVISIIKLFNYSIIHIWSGLLCCSPELGLKEVHDWMVISVITECFVYFFFSSFFGSNI